MTTYHFSNALAYSQAQLAEMHNASFSGYFFPSDMAAEISAWFWRVFHIDATACIVMHDEHEAFVGMARMGLRGQRGWCGGFGIVPAFRGTGASKLLAKQMVQAARESGLSSLQLEVLTQNVKAIKLYEGAGFVATRRLIGIETAVSALPESASSLQAQAVAPETFLSRLYEGHQSDWEREPASILALRAEAVATPGAEGHQHGFIFRRAGEKIQILAAILPNDLPQAGLAALLRAAAGTATAIQVFNEPEKSLFLARCGDLGFTEFFSQHEMYLTL